jgi:hypothetical protein
MWFDLVLSWFDFAFTMFMRISVFFFLFCVFSVLFFHLHSSYSYVLIKRGGDIAKFSTG